MSLAVAPFLEPFPSAPNGPALAEAAETALATGGLSWGISLQTQKPRDHRHRGIDRFVSLDRDFEVFMLDLVAGAGFNHNLRPRKSPDPLLEKFVTKIRLGLFRAAA